MSDFTTFIEEFINKQLEKIEISFVAEIVTFNKETMTATIKPFLKAVSDNEEILTADQQNIPVEFIYAGGAYIRPDYQNGDLVRVICAASSLEPGLDRARVNTLRNRFNLNYCSVVQGIAPKNFTPPGSFSEKDGLLIGKGSNFLQFTDSGVIVEGDLIVSGEVTAKYNSTNVSLSTHIHSSSGAPPTPGS